jgi:hypothetical protein
LLNKRLQLKESEQSILDSDDKVVLEMEEIGKLIKSPVSAYKLADAVNKRRLVISMVENLTLDGKKLVVAWKKPFDIIAKRLNPSNGGDGGN